MCGAGKFPASFLFCPEKVRPGALRRRIYFCVLACAAASKPEFRDFDDGDFGGLSCEPRYRPTRRYTRQAPPLDFSAFMACFLGMWPACARKCLIRLLWQVPMTSLKGCCSAKLLKKRCLETPMCGNWSSATMAVSAPHATKPAKPRRVSS